MLYKHIGVFCRLLVFYCSIVVFPLTVRYDKKTKTEIQST